ncbi:MAG: hypothetical protein H6657_25550 [Ardenticatenaceae bacterium]|nr:hypothetical protein [Ardenticatenaceae bacterium]
MAHTFVALPKDGEAVLLVDQNGKNFRQVLWGDWLLLDDDQANIPLGNGWRRIIWAPESDNPRTLYIETRFTSEKRPLEIIFLDVGQGDGAVLITPEGLADERVIVIDAGERQDMHEFLKIRFSNYRDLNFEAAIITHPDEDHYYGFRPIFEDPKIGFKTVYHNGLVERADGDGFERIGGLTTDPILNEEYLENLAIDTDDIEALFGPQVDIGRKKFASVMRAALENQKINSLQILSPFHGKEEAGRIFMPEFAPSDNKPYSIEVLGPLVEKTLTGKPRLRKIGDYGETKNGHSVILRLQYSKIKVLFGGDLNEDAEKFLLTQYAGLNSFPAKGSDEYEAMKQAVSVWFAADVMKVCHHGSEKVTDAFMETVHPTAFVISSGDKEGYVHPRPDLLGRLGRIGRGEAPVLLSTELQRSTREKEDEKLVARLKREINKLPNNNTPERRKHIDEMIGELAKTNIDVYGSIYVKTDGERLIAAFKKESASETEKWFYFEYMLDNNGILTLISR